VTKLSLRATRIRFTLRARSFFKRHYADNDGGGVVNAAIAALAGSGDAGFGGGVGGGSVGGGGDVSGGVASSLSSRDSVSARRSFKKRLLRLTVAELAARTPSEFDERRGRRAAALRFVGL
jgi:hypothetical protein